MKITFQPTESPEIGNQNLSKQNEIKRSERSSSRGIVIDQSMDQNWIVGSENLRKKGKSLAEIQQEAGNIDVGIQQDYRTILSNTMSSEDYAQMEQEGFDFSAMEPEEAVTIVDKIKAELIRSGQHVAGYTDDLDMETLVAALGSETLAGAVKDSFQNADIPLTRENVDGVKKAWDMASVLQKPSEDSYRYMVDNRMEAQVWDFYLSQSSGISDGSVKVPRFYAEDIQGYYTESANVSPDIDVQGEIKKFFSREGLSAEPENFAVAVNLLEGGLPLTKENMSLLQELKSVEFPVSEEVFAKAAATAVAEGKEPIQGDLAKTDNIYQKAVKILAYFEGDMEQFADLDDVVSRRQLEEIRLRMSAEVNVKLIKSGFAIDTAPMEELIEALRRVEAEVARKYFPGDEDAVSKYELYQSTNAVVEELPGLPAQIIGPFSVEEHLATLEQFHEEGRSLQETYTKAQTEYETLMTAPRKDLGDSIRKAFANVDDILKDLDLSLTETNRRAVRILGYNQMTIDAENIQRVKMADAQVQSVTNKMTPASVLKMIRDGANPLEMNFDELERYFESLPETYEESADSYSRFLYGLEQNKEITLQEREAYIGIYRMLHQIDASDGAAIGALVNVGAELQFSTLLSAVRSNKFKTMDISVTDDFGATVEVIRKGESISEQIARGFVNDTRNLLKELSYSEETAEEYRQMELTRIRQAAVTSGEAVEMLIRGQLPRSAENLLAAQALANSSYSPFKEWKNKRNVEEYAGDKVYEDDFPENNPVEHLNGKEEFQGFCAEMVKGMLQEVEGATLQQADKSLDVRSMQLIHKQLSVIGKLVQEEEYIFPMYIGEELTKVHLTLNKSDGMKGTVNISVDLSAEEHLEASLYAEGKKVTGFLIGNGASMVTKMEKLADIFIDSVQNSMGKDWEVDKLPIVNRQESNTTHRRQTSVNREVPGGEETYKEVDNTELYRIAKAFLEAVQK